MTNLPITFLLPVIIIMMDDSVDDRAPKESLDGIDGREIEQCFHHRRKGHRRVKRRSFHRFPVKAGPPAVGFPKA